MARPPDAWTGRPGGARRPGVVSLTPSNTELLWALGLQSLLVGVDDHSDFPPEVAGLPRVGPDLKVKVARVVELRPDLVLASLSVPGMERNVAELERAGLPFVVLNPLSLDEVLGDVQRVADILGYSERALGVVAALRGRIRAVEARALAERAGRPEAHPARLFWEWWHRPVITPGARSWINDLCRLVGAENVYGDADATSLPVEAKAVAARDPDAVLVCWCGVMQARMRPEILRGRPGWRGLRALRDGRVYPLPEALFGRPGPRLVDGLECLAELLLGDPRAAARRWGLAWAPAAEETRHGAR